MSIAACIRSSTSPRGCRRAEVVAVGQHRPFGGQRRGAGQIGDRRELLLDDDRRHAFGNGDQPLDRLAVLQDVEHLGAAASPWGSRTRRPGSGRRAEQPRHHAIGRRRCPGSRPASRAGRATEPSAGAFLDDHVMRSAASGPAPTTGARSPTSAGEQPSAADDSRLSAASPHTAFMISEALVPPKPKLLLSTALTWRFLALCGTRSTPAVPSLGLSRLSVGGTIWSRMREDAEDALDRARAAEQMADRRLGRAHRQRCRWHCRTAGAPRPARARRRAASRCHGR